MIEEDTVFILGAGASWHYGYPTGEELVSCVIQMAERFANYCKFRMNVEHSWVVGIPEYVQQKYDTQRGLQGALDAWRLTFEECEDIRKRLTIVRPVVIDFFLSWNEHLHGIGTLLIAAVILEREAEWLEQRRNGNRKAVGTDISNRLPQAEPDPWYRFVTHWLLHGCRESSQLLENKVKLVTFNYDVSLDSSLYEALSSHSLLTTNDVKSFLSGDRIVHVYGSVRQPEQIASRKPLPSQHFRQLGVPTGVENAQMRIMDALNLLNLAYEASKGIRTIDIHKEDNNPQLEQVVIDVGKASRIYLLGYGFEPANSRRIGLANLHASGPRPGVSILAFTNYNNHGTINRAAWQLFGGEDHLYARSEPRSFLVNMLNRTLTIQKSVRSVYDALSMDLDPPQ